MPDEENDWALISNLVNPLILMALPVLVALLT